MPKPANLNSKDRRNRLLFRIHGKSQAITRFRIQYTLDITTASTETLLVLDSKQKVI
jgi:hypothetical protein